MMLGLSNTSIQLRTVFCSPWENINLTRDVNAAIENGKTMEVNVGLVGSSLDDSYKKLREKVTNRSATRVGPEKVLDLLTDSSVKPFIEMMVESLAMFDDENHLLRNGIDMMTHSNIHFHDTGRIFHLMTMVAAFQEAVFPEFVSEVLSQLIDEGFLGEDANLLLQMARLALDVRASIKYRDEATQFQVLYRARRVRRIFETVLGMYASELVGEPRPGQKPLVMQLQAQVCLQAVAGLSMWTATIEHGRVGQNIEFSNILGRLTFRVVENKHFAIICRPAMIISCDNDARGLPLPRYAMAILEFRSLNTADDLYVHSGLVTQDAMAIRADGTKDELHSVYRLELSKGLVSSDRELETRFLLIAGPHVPDDLLDDYIGNHVASSGKYLTQAKDAIRIADGMTNLADELLQSVARVRALLDNYEIPDSDEEDEDADTGVVEHADMDDTVPKLRGVVAVDKNKRIMLSRPKGKEWKERVLDQWQGEIDGVWTRVTLNKNTGKIDTSGRWLPLISSTNKYGEIGICIGPVTFKVGKNCPGNHHNLSKTLTLLSSKVPPAVVRMALYSIEMHGAHTDTNGACYMPRNGNGPKVNHIAAIPANVFSGVDVYYRRKDKAVFLLTMTRSLRLTIHPERSKMYHVTEASFDKSECMLAHIKLREGNCG